MDEIPEDDPQDDMVYIFGGRHIKRGLYRSANGQKVNADLNGAANRLRPKGDRIEAACAAI